MPGKTILFIAILVVAVAAPYVLSKRAEDDKTAETAQDASFWDRLTQLVSRDGAAAEPDPRMARGRLPSSWQTAGRQLRKSEKTGPPGLSIADLLRFDATADWISANWSRVTTPVADGDLRGVRVPVVTGTEPHDLAGSLTYYFNPQRQVERIKFFGYTAEFEPLATWLQQRHGLRQYASAETALYLSFFDKTPIGALRVRMSSAPQLDEQGTRFQVELELNLPHANAKLSDSMYSSIYRLQQGQLL